MQIGGETIVPKWIAAQRRGGRISRSRGVQREQKLGGITERLRAIFQPLRQQSAAALGARQVVEDVKMRTDGNVQIVV